MFFLRACPRVLFLLKKHFYIFCLRIGDFSFYRLDLVCFDISQVQYSASGLLFLSGDGISVHFAFSFSGSTYNAT